MTEQITLESLASRIEVLERAVMQKGDRKKDWRKSIGLFADSAFMRQVDEEGRKIREADRDTE
jgi:hypothetical protein